jgi:hypothetical protein
MIPSTCINTDGGYNCSCISGYTGDPYYSYGCADINECLEDPVPCGNNANCQDTYGSYKCTCKSGYDGDGHINCTDIDECVTGDFYCGTPKVCNNTVGYYECICDVGYYYEYSYCYDIDECTEDTHTCSTNELCWNIAGGFECYELPASRICREDPYQLDCCTTSNPCVLMDGDCDSSYNCEGDFICGTDNCIDNLLPTDTGSGVYNSISDCCVPPTK